MPDDDLETILLLIAEAKRLAYTRQLGTVAYLLDMAIMELGKTPEAQPAPKRELIPDRRRRRARP
jgi:hypothetical protein